MSLGVTASSDPLLAGLVGWYRMLGNANDSSGRGNTGSLVNAPTLVADKYENSNASYSFNGSDQYVGLTLASGLPLYANEANSRFTVTGWVKGAAQFNRFIYSEGSSTSNNQINAIYNDNGKLSFYLRDNNFNIRVGVLATKNTVFDSTWHHFAVVYNHSTFYAAIYVDGALNVSQTHTAWTSQLTTNRCSIAALNRSSASLHFAGSISDFRLYNRVLTAGEVKTLATTTARI